MADLRDELRDELMLALEKLQPQIRGLQYYSRFVPVGSEFLLKIQQELDVLVRRRGLIQAVMNLLDEINQAKEELNQDGYPNLHPVRLPKELWDELKLDAKQLDAAEALFELVPNMKINLGAVGNKS